MTTQEQEVKSLNDVAEKLVVELKAAKQKQQSTLMGVLGLAVILALYVLYTSRSSVSLSEFNQERKIQELQMQLNKQEVDFLTRDTKRSEDEINRRLATLESESGLLKTRADGVDRRLSNGGVK